MPNAAIKRREISHHLPHFTVDFSSRALTQREWDWPHSGLRLEEVWKKSRGAGVRVAVLDTGCDLKHPDLQGSLKDAKDFTRSRLGAEDAPTMGHGTHCAGVIAAVEDDKGIMGVAPDLGKDGGGLLIGKVLGDDGSGQSSWIAAGIEWAAANGAKIISMSLGSPFRDETIIAAIRKALAANIVVICAAGNDGQRGVNWPGAYEGVISVAAYDRHFKVAPFSSRGPEVDIAAPGVDILSTVPKSQYARMSGTCIAAGSYVYGIDGPKTIESVQAGDVVYAFKDGQLVQRAVSQTHFRGRNEVLHLISAGRDVEATASHEMLTINSRSREIEWTRCGQLDPDVHRLLMPKSFESQVNPYLDRIVTEDFAWLAGFFLGDGWVSHTNRGARVNFARKISVETNERLNRCYEIFVGKPVKDSASRWCYDDSSMMAMLFEVIGMNFPSTEKTVPLWVWSIAESKQRSFFAGYCASDGHEVHQAGYRASPQSFECGSADLIRRLSILCDYRGWKRGAVSSRTRLLQAPNSPEASPFTSHMLRAYPGVARDGGWSFLRSGKARQNGEQRASEMGIDVSRFFAASFRVEESSRQSDVFDLTIPGADCFVTQGVVTHNSMATPHVAGIAALLLAAQKRKKWNTESVKAVLISQAADAGQPGFDGDYGYGLIRPDRIELDVEAPPVPPGRDGIILGDWYLKIPASMDGYEGLFAGKKSSE